MIMIMTIGINISLLLIIDRFIS